MVPSKPVGSRAALKAAPASTPSAPAQGGGSSGWAVLQQDGLVGAFGTGTRLKDWDKLAESEDEDVRAAAGHAQGSDSSESDGEW